MFRLRKYLKPFALGVAFAIVLLFIQALCDLNLPNYMSNIVNIGIQQNGIEHGTPDALSSDGYTFIKTFMASDEKALLDANYTEADSAGYKDRYPDASGQIHVLNSGISSDTIDELDTTFGTATWTMINVMKSLPNQNAAGATSNSDSASTNLSDVDLKQVYQMQPMLGMLPQSTFDKARQDALTLDDFVLKQSSTILVSSFYKELGVDMGGYQNGYIIRIGALMLLIALISGGATILVSLLSSRIAAGVAKNLRNDIFEKVEKFSNEEYDHFSTASLITRSTNDVTQIQMFLTMGIRMICYAPIMGVGGVIMAVNKAVSMSWIIAAAVIALMGLILVVYIAVMPKFKAMQKLVDRLNLVARETLNGLMVIRAFGTSGFEKKRFDVANQDLAKTNLFTNRAMAYMFPVMMLIMNGITILVIWVGSHQVADSVMQVGDMMAFMQYAMQIIMSFLFLSIMFIFIPRASVSATRIADVLETKPTIIDPVQSKTMGSENKGFVEFNNVSFRYRGAEEDALKDISFTARPGETIAFIGPTGAGKSTLVNLIPRFYDVTGGSISINGVDVRDVTQHELRSHIGYVPQQSILMSGTIASNISYGNEDLSEDEMKDIAIIAQSLDFIEEKEDGFKSDISQGGSNVSGGQRQRLSIARALAVKPDIYIFDDIFSALDFKTDSALRAALKNYTDNSTVIIVAQRVSTIMNADQIFVLDNGEIVGHGTHKELLRSCSEYYEIASSQLSKEELDHE